MMVGQAMRDRERELNVFRNRLMLAGLVIITAFGILVARFTWLQVVQREYYHKAAPPQKILDKAQARVFRRRNGSQPDQVTYVLSRRKIFGFEICTGWTVVLHPEGGGQPDGFYTVGLCSKSDFTPAYAEELPTISPHPAPTPGLPSHM